MVDRGALSRVEEKTSRLGELALSQQYITCRNG
jgi:hypothetical protein